MFGFRKIAVYLIVLSMSASVIGCGNNNAGSKQPAAGSGLEQKYGDTYPIQSDHKLTYWVQIHNQHLTGLSNYSEQPFYQEVMKRTGIDIEFIHPTSDEQFNIMLASGVYPDIMEVDFYRSPGGPNKASDEGIIIPLNDAIDKFAPNLKKILSENPDLDRLAKTDEGQYYCFPLIFGDETLITYQGLMLREDWLKELSLAVPETIDEWYHVLTQFKNKKGASAPVSFLIETLKGSAAFSAAFDVKDDLYVDNGTVKYGPLEPGYLKYITTMSKWYGEGLIDKNVATLDSKTLTQAVLDAKSGAMIGNVGGGMGNWTKAAAALDPKFKLVAAPYPAMNKGEKVRFSQYGNMASTSTGAGYVSAQCQDVELAARFLDYGYSEEGHMLFNFGVEGVAYNMVDGYPKYTDLITKDPQGRGLVDMLYIYARPNGNGPYVQDPRYMEQNASLPEQKNALKVWTDVNTAQTYLPTLYLTSEESMEISRIQTDIRTYVSESFLGFLMGTKPLAEYDAFTAQLKTMGVDKYLDIYQAAYDRSLRR